MTFNLIPKKSIFRKVFYVILTVIISLGLYFGTNISYLLKTSFIGIPEHAPFDGTTYPIKKVPDWVHLSETERNLSYSSLPENKLIDIPYYNPDKLQISTDTLKWGNTDDDFIRNAKITYPVPYLGNYKLDGKENAGSHPAVDIKVPEGTPVFAIANGVVIKASNQTSGFGKHIVIRHNNINTVLYSSYNHLSGLLVSEGEIVTKGQQIGLSGSTGTATTPHLHFQIDNDSAPWHPYWPFTWEEVVNNNLDFFSAINAGLGKEKAVLTTVNPMQYVQTYLAGTNSNILSETNSDSYVATENTNISVVDNTDAATTPNELTVSDNTDSIPDENDASNIEKPVLVFKFEVSPIYYTDHDSEFSVLLKDQNGEIFRDGFLGTITVSSENGLVTVENALADITRFNNEGKMAGKFNKMNPGKDRLKIEYEGNTYYSEPFDVVDNVISISFSDLPQDNKYYEAVNFLIKEGVVNGYPDDTFRPNNVVSRVEALKFIFEGIKEALKTGKVPFPDVSIEEWYGKYLYTAYDKGVIEGYPDGTFKPTNTVNRAEFYKILFNGMGIDINPNVNEAPFADVSADAWFAPYIAYAKKLGIIEADIQYLKPSEGMTRGEVAYGIYKLMETVKK